MINKVMEFAILFTIYFSYIAILLFCRWPVALMAGRLRMGKGFIALQFVPVLNLLAIVYVIRRLKAVDKA